MPKVPSKAEVKCAHAAVTRAIRSGDLIPRRCQSCNGRLNVQAHHEDYSKPLDVLWLCASCHRLIHVGRISVKDLRDCTRPLPARSVETFVRLRPLDFKKATHKARRRGLPVSAWMRTVILDRLNELDSAAKERENAQ